MTHDHLIAILKASRATLDKQTWTMPDGSTLTLYLAHDGVSLTMNRVSSLRLDGEEIYARTAKSELFSFSRDDLFAVALEGEVGLSTRRAGFG